LVTLSDNTQVEVKSLKKGDLVQTPQGSTKVLCVVKTKKLDGFADLCTMKNGLQITKHHPIKHNGVWKFPSDLVAPEMIACDFVYNLVVSDHHIVFINEVPVILLGHNYKTGILNHPYLGSQKVVDDLKAMPGWSNGLIQLEDGCMIKNKKTNECKLIYNGQENAVY
jgi:hypothetical protein